MLKALNGTRSSRDSLSCGELPQGLLDTEHRLDKVLGFEKENLPGSQSSLTAKKLQRTQVRNRVLHTERAGSGSGLKPKHFHSWSQLTRTPAER